MSDRATSALVPATERIIDFYGDPLTVAHVPGDDVYVPLRTIAEFLGLDWSSQHKRIQRDEVLARRARTVMMTSADGKQREMFCVPLDLLPGWLFGITATRVRAELAPKLQRYREECFRVLWRAFQSEIVPSPQAASAPLAQVRDLALAIAQMADQQLALQGQVLEVRTQSDQVTGEQLVLRGQVTAIDSRVDRAAMVIKELQRRLGFVEDQVQPPAYISEVQAAEISNQVKALAELLTGTDKAKNHYQGIFAELYRRFGVSSYKLIRQEQYAQVLQFLEDWRVTRGQ